MVVVRRLGMYSIYEHIIPRECIEIKLNGKWINLQDYHDSVSNYPDWAREVMNLVEVNK